MSETPQQGPGEGREVADADRVLKQLDQLLAQGLALPSDGDDGPLWGDPDLPVWGNVDMDEVS